MIHLVKKKAQVNINHTINLNKFQYNFKIKYGKILTFFAHLAIFAMEYQKSPLPTSQFHL